MKVKFAHDARLEWLPFKDKILKFRAKISSISQDNFFATTYLLTNIIYLSENVIVNHCWVNDGSHIKKKNLKIGDTIEFESKVHVYLKNGFGINQRADLALSTPRNIIIL